MGKDVDRFLLHGHDMPFELFEIDDAGRGLEERHFVQRGLREVVRVEPFSLLRRSFE